MENRYFAIVKDGVIFCVGIGEQAEEISRERYEAVIDAIKNPPVPRDGYGHRLKTDLSWEEFKIEESQPMPDEEISDAEALSILLGGVGE